MRRHRDRDARVHPRELLDRDRVAEVVGAAAAVLLGVGDAHQAELAELLDDLVREALLRSSSSATGRTSPSAKSRTSCRTAAAPRSGRSACGAGCYCPRRCGRSSGSRSGGPEADQVGATPTSPFLCGRKARAVVPPICWCGDRSRLDRSGRVDGAPGGEAELGSCRSCAEGPASPPRRRRGRRKRRSRDAEGSSAEPSLDGAYVRLQATCADAGRGRRGAVFSRPKSSRAAPGTTAERTASLARTAVEAIPASRSTADRRAHSRSTVVPPAGPRRRRLRVFTLEARARDPGPAAASRTQRSTAQPRGPAPPAAAGLKPQLPAPRRELERLKVIARNGLHGADQCDRHAGQPSGRSTSTGPPAQPGALADGRVRTTTTPACAPTGSGRAPRARTRDPVRQVTWASATLTRFARSARPVLCWPRMGSLDRSIHRPGRQRQLGLRRGRRRRAAAASAAAVVGSGGGDPIVVVVVFGLFGLFLLYLVDPQRPLPPQAARARPARADGVGRGRRGRRVLRLRRARARTRSRSSARPRWRGTRATAQALARLVGPDLLVEWNRRLDDFDRKGWHNRVEVLGDPRSSTSGITNREDDTEDRAVVRIEAKLRAYVLDSTATRSCARARRTSS